MTVLDTERLDSIDSLYFALLQCFGIILLGYLAGRFQVITETNALNTFVGSFSLPALIFLSIADLDFSTVNWRFFLAVLVAKSFIFFIVLISTLLLSKPFSTGRSAIFAIFTTQSNDFAIGYPMIDALYSSTHPDYSSYLYLMGPISLLLLNPVGLVLLEISRYQSSSSSSSSSFASELPIADAKDEKSRNYAIELLKVIKGIVLNPVLFMTVFGILANLTFKHDTPKVILVVFDSLGNVFSAGGLFLLGLMTVGKVGKLKGSGLLLPILLTVIKLVALPLIIREVVILMDAGSSASETFDLSTFGFLYGTLPTAPALFIYTLRYNVDVDMIASAVVICTVLSAPLTFVTAKLISDKVVSYV